MSISISLDRRKIIKWLIIITVFLIVISLLGNIFQILMNGDNAHDLIKEWVRVINISVDRNIPTWYSSLLMLLVSIILGIIALDSKVEKDPYTRHWFWLGVIFFLFSVDETASIHENFSRVVYYFVETSGLLTFAWVVVGAIFTLLVAVLYFKFLTNLPPRTRNGFVLAGAVYVVGALVLEAISGAVYYDTISSFTYPYVIISTLEESLEMFGTILFMYVLLRYMEEREIKLQLHMVKELGLQTSATSRLTSELSRQHSSQD